MDSISIPCVFMNVEPKRKAKYEKIYIKIKVSTTRVTVATVVAYGIYEISNDKLKAGAYRSLFVFFAAPSLGFIYVPLRLYTRIVKSRKIALAIRGSTL